MKGILLAFSFSLFLLAGCRTGEVANEEAIPTREGEASAYEGTVTEQADVREDASLQDEELRLLLALTESLKRVQHSYVEEVDTGDLIYSAIDGMLQSLDPHSSFLAKESYQELEEDSTGHFSGLGVTVNPATNGVRVIEPIENSPAEKAGIRAGDTIVAVGSQKISPDNYSASMERLRGEKGTSVRITVQKPSGEERVLDLVREDIRISSVKGFEPIGEGLFYVRIDHFSQSVPEDFEKVLSRLEKEGAKGLIIDLRDNPGGVLSAATSMASLLLRDGLDIVTVKGRRVKDEMRQFRSEPMSQKNTELPIALLVNGDSASAAEILSGALKAHGRAKLIGQKTFGKASVQTVIPLQFDKGCAIRLTTAYYYTPDGKLIHGHGIEPDEVVSVSKTEHTRISREQRQREIHSAEKSFQKTKRNDPQFDRARKILLQQISGDKEAEQKS